MQTWKHVGGGRISRRGFLGVGTAAALGVAGARPASAAPTGASRAAPGRHGPYTDEPVTLAGARARWRELGVVGDERGTLSEVTPAKTTDALHRLRGGEAKVYDLGEPMYPGIPAFENVPPRRFDIYTTRYGPSGDNELTFLEDRFAGFTYQIASQVDQLNHIGIGGVYYGDFREDDIVRLPDLRDPLARQARAEEDARAGDYGEDSILGGTRRHGLQHMGPIVTRGVLLDILAVKQEEDAADALAEDGETLRGDYRITLVDLEAAMEHGRVGSIEPGDVVVIRTGWSKLWEDPSRWDEYLATEPGIWLAEARWLARHRPAMVASDTWGVEVVPAPREGSSFEGHQLLITQEGIRIGEAFVCEELAADGVHEFVFADSPPVALGATAANNAPMAIGVPRRGGSLH